MLIIFKMLILSKGSLLSRSLACTWQLVFKGFLLHGGEGVGLWVGGCGEDSRSSFATFINFVLGMKCSVEKKEHCFYEVDEGTGRRKCEKDDFSILFLKRRSCDCISSKPNVLRPV